jgi:hypothetical protein
MPLVSQTYAGAFLNAADLGPLGQRRTALIHAVTVETIGQENRQVLVLDLVGSNGRPWPKRAVLNKSNSVQMAAAYGDNTDGWLGKRIEIWAENVFFQGRLVPGIKTLPALAAAPPAGGTGAAASIPATPPVQAAPVAPLWLSF